MYAQGKDHERTQENGPQEKRKLPSTSSLTTRKISFNCLSLQTLVTRHRSPNTPKLGALFLTTMRK